MDMLGGMVLWRRPEASSTYLISYMGLSFRAATRTLLTNPIQTSSFAARDDANVPDSLPSVDWLDDDAVDPPESADFSDDHGFKRDSAWNEWEPSEEAPILSILLLEKLGKTYQQELPVESNEPNPAVISDIKAVLDEVHNAGVLHENVSAFNILRTPSRSRCKLHHKLHHWRLVDFDRSRAFDNTYDNRQLMRERKLEGKDIGLEKNTVFWGTLER